MAIYDKSGKPIKSGRTVSEVDKEGARELALFAENTSEIYNGVLTSVLTNLQRKAKKGIYDKNKAVVAWLHVIDEAAKLYDNWYGSGRDSLQLFNKATRMEAARQLMNRLEEDVFQDVEIKSSKQIKSSYDSVDILDKLEDDLDKFFKKKHIDGYIIESWTDRKGSERTFEYYCELPDNKNVDSGALYDYLFSYSEVLLHNFDFGVTVIPRRKFSFDMGVDKKNINIIITVPNDFVNSSRKPIKSSFNYYDGFENDVKFFAEKYSDNDDIVEMVAGDIENDHPTESPEEFDSLMRAVQEELKQQGYFKQPWQVNSSRQIKSAVDGGWEVRSSDVPEALDLFVEHYGEETALEEIAKAMSTDTLLENVEWVARQWGFGEDLESVEGTWNKYEYAKEVMGVKELFNNLTQAAGYDELAEDLAFIFRQYDFREWYERDGVYSALDTWVDPRSKVDGWKVKVLDVYPDDYSGSTTAKVELFDPEGNSTGVEGAYIHRQDVKIGEIYDAKIDGLMAMPKIIGVPDISYDEVPDIRKVTRDRYLKNSKEDKADEDGPHMKFKTLDEDTKFELREQIEDELEALLDKLNVKFTTDVWEETVQYILSFFEEDNAYNPKTAKQAVHEWYLDTKDDFPEMFDSKKQKVASARYCEWIRSKRLIKSAKKFFK